MPDLGKYAFEVLTAYGVSIALLLLLTVLSIAQSRRAKAELAGAEKSRSETGQP